MVDQAFLRLEGVSHGYGNITILNKANFILPPACLVALTAPSGAGKSTLLHIAGLLERPNAGEVYFGSQAGWAMEEAERTKLRRHQIGFIFQFHHLLPEFNALENINLPLLIAGKSKQEANDRSKSLLEKIGLSHRAKHLPAELSGGEQQRIALARALANRPKILLADEPTGNLDPKTADIVFNLFADLVREEGASALIVTHSETLADKCDQRHQLIAGKVERRS